MDPYIENILQKGVAAHAQGRLQAAKRLYHRVLKSYPRQPDANQNL
jgi:TolA-binding protein